MFVFIFILREKPWPSFISTHQNLLLVPLEIPSWMFTLFPHEGLAPSFKILIHFCLSFSNGPYPYLKGLSQLVQKDFTFNPHRVLGIPKAWIGSQLFNKVYNILMILGSLTFKKEFWILTQKLGYVMTL